MKGKKSIDWELYDKEFVKYLFYLFESEEDMPKRKIIDLMALAFAKGKDVGWSEAVEEYY